MRRADPAAKPFLLLSVALAGCSLKYEYPEPDAAALAELERLTRPGLVVDTGRVPASPPSEPFVAEIKAEHGKLFLPAHVNGRPADLMLDYGSWVTVGLMPYMVRSAWATLSDATMPSHTLDGEGEMRTGVVDTLRIEDVTLHDIPFAMSNRDLTVKLGAMTVYRGQGLFGLPILAGYRRFAIDMAGDKLYLGSLPEALLESPDLVTLPLRAGEGMWIEVSIDGVPFELKIDIGGFGGTVLLLDEAAAAFMEKYPSRFAGHSTALGESVQRKFAARAGVVRAGAYELHDAVITVMPRGADPPVEGDAEVDGSDGVVGNRFFGETIVGVDWDAGELYFVAPPGTP